MLNLKVRNLTICHGGALLRGTYRPQKEIPKRIVAAPTLAANRCSHLRHGRAFGVPRWAPARALRQLPRLPR